MHPCPRTPHLDNQLIEIFSGFISYVEENNGIAKCLFLTIALYIRRTSYEMITRRASPYPFIHLPRSIPRVNNYRLFLKRIPLIILTPQHLQPPAKALKILYRHTTWNIPILSLITRLSHLTERKVLGEFLFLIYTYCTQLTNSL